MTVLHETLSLVHREKKQAGSPSPFSPRVPDFARMSKQAEAPETTTSPAETPSLIAPIWSSTASPRRLPGWLPQTLSSTLFSISCNHLLEIHFSFKMSPGNLNRHLRSWAQDGIQMLTLKFKTT